MGYNKNHAIIVTSWDDELLAKAYRKAYKFFNKQVSNIVKSPANYLSSFFIAPDGSKEGWETSNTGDVQREKFVTWLNKQCYADGSSSLDWVEVQYGDDNGNAIVINSGDANKNGGTV